MLLWKSMRRRPAGRRKQSHHMPLCLYVKPCVVAFLTQGGATEHLIGLSARRRRRRDGRQNSRISNGA
jgi:hypothetical protein